MGGYCIGVWVGFVRDVVVLFCFEPGLRYWAGLDALLMEAGNVWGNLRRYIFLGLEFEHALVWPGGKRLGVLEMCYLAYVLGEELVRLGE